MPVLIFLFLLVCYWLSGYGLLGIFNMRLKPAYTITLSFLLGIAVASFIPFLLQLFFIVINGPMVFGAMLVATLLLNIPSFLRMRRKVPGGSAAFSASPPTANPDPIASSRSTTPVRAASAPERPSFSPRWLSLAGDSIRGAFRRLSSAGNIRMNVYEIPFWLVLGFLIFVSVWRCYYLPPTSRDALSGPEAIAEYAVREQTMINSFFRIDLWSTNNQFKSPFLISLQIIYKLAGFPFGQIWLSIIFICFTVFLYQALTERLHPVIAGLLLLLFTMAPEMYAYTFMILYDYSNMVFFCLGLYFLFSWMEFPGFFASPTLRPSAMPTLRSPAIPILRPPATLAFAGLLLGIATYIRSETLALVVLFLPPMLLVQLRDEAGRLRRPSAARLKKILLLDGLFLLPSLIGYYLPTQLYIKYYLPVHYDIGGLVNDHLTDWHPLFQRYSDIITKLLYGTFSIRLWGYLFYVTTIVFVAELIFIRRFNKQARNWLYAMLVLYLAIGFMGFALPMFNLLETTKRALFKMMPLALFYLANSELLLRLSRAISRWEILSPAGAPSLAGATSGGATSAGATSAGSGKVPAANKTSKKKQRKK